ncbi:MAG: ComEC/Rec2 family competence protein, partial [Myxococcota bacterium]
ALYEELHATDNSLVVRVRSGEDSALWTGDIERWGERYLVASGADLRATVVKAPHHGSRTSSSDEFIAAAGAAHVLFTVGRSNQWGFPHPEVVERWRHAGAQPWDTASRGELTFRLTGRGVEVESYR